MLGLINEIAVGQKTKHFGFDYSFHDSRGHWRVADGSIVFDVLAATPFVSG